MEKLQLFLLFIGYKPEGILISGNVTKFQEMIDSLTLAWQGTSGNVSQRNSDVNFVNELNLNWNE